MSDKTAEVQKRTPDFGVTAYRVWYDDESGDWVAKPNEGPCADHYRHFVGVGESAQSALAFLREAMHVADDPSEDARDA